MYSKDILKVVTIPKDCNIVVQNSLIQNYKSVFKSDVVFVIERMTNVLSALLKKELNLDISYFKKGLNEGRDNKFIYKCKPNSSTSLIYNIIYDTLEYRYYMFVDPKVVFYKRPLKLFTDIVLPQYQGAISLATKEIDYNSLFSPITELRLDLLYIDLKHKIRQDFCSFSNKEYNKEDYGVLLCRRQFITDIGGFDNLCPPPFVHTATDLASAVGFDLEYSHDLYTYRIKGE